MDAKELRNLQEAYLEVVENQQLDEISDRRVRAERLGEQVDIYDIILSHLLDEGYAETPEAAETIMVNMSEDWRESIVEEVLDEARITRAMGKRADDYNRKKERDAYMARHNAHQERLKTDPEYRAKYERLYNVHNNNKANQNEAYGAGLRSNPSRSFLQAAVNKAASAEKAKQKQNPNSRGRVRDEDDLRDRRAEAGNWKH